MKAISQLFKTYFKLYKFLFSLRKSWITGIILEIVFSSLSPFPIIIFPKYIIDELILYKRLNVVLTLVILMLVSSILISLTRQLISSFNSYNRDVVLRIFYKNIGNISMETDFKNLEDPKFLDSFNKIKNNIGSILDSKWDIINIISSLIVVIGLGAILVRLDIIVLVVVLIAVIINFLIQSRTIKFNYQWQSIMSEPDRKFSYMAMLMLNFENGKEIRINNLKEFINNKYDTVLKYFTNEYKKVVTKYLKFNSLSNVVNIIQLAFSYGYLGYTFLKYNKLTIGDFTMFLASINTLTDSLNTIINSFIKIKTTSLYINDLYIILNTNNCDSNNSALKLDKERLNDELEIKFENVYFKYPGTEEYLFKNLNFTININRNEKLAIVGINGAGKTSLIKLILRLYKPTSGTILLNGRNIWEFDYESYINAFAVVFQDFKLFAFSIKENVVLNNENNDKLLSDCFDKLELSNFISNLPIAEQTMLFKIFDENGIELSGGYGQKIALARALYKNSPIIILDEPSSALDPIAEYNLYQNFNKIINNKFSIFISHRLAITRFCKSIIVMDKGEIAEYGSHHELMSNNGLYAEMYNKQKHFFNDVSIERII